MATLQDLGYKHWEPPRSVPLLVILAQYPGRPPVGPESAYNELVFGSSDATKKSVVGYFHETSKGRFRWSRVAVISVDLTAGIRDESDDVKRATLIIQETAKKFDFSPFDRDRDGRVAGFEIAIVVFEAGGGALGATRGVGNGPISAAGVLEPVCLMGDQALVQAVSHELTHWLRGIDMYGEENHADLNSRLSLMSTTGTTENYHHDPWHKMRFGWLEPRIRNLYEPMTETLAPASGFRGDEAVILFDPMRGTEEYFIVEYRSPLVGIYDSEAIGNGLVIWHVVPDSCHVPANPLTLGPPHLERGKTGVWNGGQMTPKLQWADGTDTGIVLTVWPFVPGAGSITFSWDRAGRPMPAFFDWANLGGNIRQPCAAKDSNGCIAVFAVGSDWSLWQNRQSAANSRIYNGWLPLYGDVREPCVAQNLNGRLEVFVVGADNALWNLPETGVPGAFQAWRSLDGNVRQPCAIRNKSGKIEVFAVGSDGALWHIKQVASGGAYGIWESLEGNIRQPCAIHDQKGRVSVFGVGSDGALWRISQTNDEEIYSDWVSLDGDVADPVVTRIADGRIQIFAVGRKNELFTCLQTDPNSETYQGWTRLCGTVWEPTVITNRHGCNEVYAVDTNGALWWQRQLAKNGPYSAWMTLGGGVRDPIVIDNMNGQMDILGVAPSQELWHLVQQRPL